MINLKQFYEETRNKRKSIVAELKKLEKDEAVKKYIDLKNKSEEIYKDEKELFKALKLGEYSECSHILINPNSTSCGCMKCGLTYEALDKDPQELTFIDQIMQEYLRRNPDISGLQTDIQCDLAFAVEAYSEIKAANPEITDEMAIKCFELTLDNIKSVDTEGEKVFTKIAN